MLKLAPQLVETLRASLGGGNQQNGWFAKPGSDVRIRLGVVLSGHVKETGPNTKVVPKLYFGATFCPSSLETRVQRQEVASRSDPLSRRRRIPNLRYPILKTGQGLPASPQLTGLWIDKSA